MTIIILFFISALLPIGISLWLHRTNWPLLLVVVVYSLCCLLAVIVFNMPTFIGNIGMISLVAFNLLSAIWIWKGYRFWTWLVCAVIVSGICVNAYYHRPFKGHSYTKEGDYIVVDYPTSHISERSNHPIAIVLHHTGSYNIKSSLRCLSGEEGKVSSHALIDLDGTRYILAKPTEVTWHAGESRLNGREYCNNFTIGIEFQGNTAESPLTDVQIESAIDYIIPIMKKYGIDEGHIVTHKQIRDDWLKHHKNSKAAPKIDISDSEYDRFMTKLHQRYENN